MVFTKGGFSTLIIMAVVGGLIALLAGGYFVYQPLGSRESPVACTQEAKLCSDGSSVGRIPPSCEFAACPGEKNAESTKSAPPATKSTTPVVPKEATNNQPAKEEQPQNPIEIVAENLQVPWEVSFLPDGDILVTERPGILRKIGSDKRVYAIEGVEHVEEGGLLGMALHPKFKENRWIYIYLTTTKTDGSLENKVERYYFNGTRLSDKKIIVDNIPSAPWHDGGRIAFGPDKYLYITTGDAGREELSQNINSLAGKILRLKDDGSVPSDNPFGNAIWSYGHRNSQGLAWDNKGRLWATEHGRSGALSGFDELNLIEKGKNYGWPVIQGDEINPGMEKPVVHSGPDETWAPAGATFIGGSIFFGGLRGESLYEAQISGAAVAFKSHFRKEFGRIRAVVLGPDGFIYITTSNRDGRGVPRKGDDKIIKINRKIFK